MSNHCFPLDENEDEAGKGSGGDLNDFGKLFANDAIKGIFRIGKQFISNVKLPLVLQK